MAEHYTLVDADLHKPGYVQANDPGPTGPGKLWIDTSLGPGLWVMKLRNNADSGWENLGQVMAGGIYLKIRGTNTYALLEIVYNESGDLTTELNVVP